MLKRRQWFAPVLVDFIAFSLAFAGAVELLPWMERLLQTNYLPPHWLELWPTLAIGLGLLIPSLFLADCYRIPSHWTGWRLFRALGVAHAAMITGYLTITIIFPDALAPVRKGVVTAAFLSVVLAWCARRIWSELFGQRGQRRRALLIGSQVSAVRSLQRFARENVDSFDVVGLVDDFRDGGYFENFDVEFCGTSDSLPTILKTRPVDTLIVLNDQSRYADRIVEILDAFPTVKEVYVRAQIPLFVAQDINLLFVRDVPLLKVYSRSATMGNSMVREWLDRALAVVAIILCLPIFVVVPILIKLDSRGPVFYKQRRLGKGNKPYWVYKFRSMGTDAEAKGAVLAARNDPRVTRVGRILRKLRIDEVPQFLNVLRGEMALIGPRPERPEFQNVYVETIPWYSLRSLCRPGITGLAQVSGDYHTSTQRKLLYDVSYLANMSLLLDVRIALATILTVLTKQGH